MDIEVNEYVRTKDGHIAKYIEKLAKDEDVSDGMLFDGYIYEKHKHIRYSFLKEIIVKHSKELIDLIEVGDFVNGYRVKGKTEKKIAVDYYCYSEELGEENWLILYNDMIQTILTKEQYMANCYKVGGEDEN